MIPFVRDIAFEYGQVDQVSPLIRRVVANNPGPFTFKGTGTYIIGRGEVAVIDPGPAMDDHLEALLAATAGETITTIVTTHTHLTTRPCHDPWPRAPAPSSMAAPRRSWVRPACGSRRTTTATSAPTSPSPTASAWKDPAGPWRPSPPPATPPTMSATPCRRRTPSSPATTSWAGPRP